MARLSGRQTPVVATAFTTLIAAALILTGELGTLADTTVLPVLGVGSCLLVMTQVEAETWAQAGALLGLGLALWALQRIGSR